MLSSWAPPKTLSGVDLGSMPTDPDPDPLPEPHDGMTPEEKGDLLVQYAAAGRSVEGLDFEDADVRETDLAGADLRGARLARATFQLADLSGASLGHADLTAAEFADTARDGFHSKCTADYATCERSEWGVEQIAAHARAGLDFDLATFPEALRFGFVPPPTPDNECSPSHKRELLNMYVRNGLSVDGLDFSEADLKHMDLRGANLAGVSLRGAQLYRADLTGACLRGAYLSGAQLGEADLTGADLSDASLRGASVGSTCFGGAVLSRADISRAQANSGTYVRSGWTPHQLLEFRSVGLELVDLDTFPAEAQRAIIGVSQGLTLTFDTRLHRFDPTAFSVLIAEVLGPDTDVGIEEQSRPDVTPGFIRINGSNPHELIAVVEAFYDRVWRSVEAMANERAVATVLSSGMAAVLAALDRQADQFVKLEANVEQVVASTAILADDELREAITDHGTEHLLTKGKASFQTRFQRIATAVYEDAKKFTKAAGTIDAVVAVVTELVTELQVTLETGASQRLEKRLIDTGIGSGTKVKGEDP